MAPMKKNPSKKKTTKSTKCKSRRNNDCCASSDSSSSSDETSSSSSLDSSETSESESSDSTDCCDCSDCSDCSDCWDCKVPSRNKRGDKKARGKIPATKLPHKVKKKPARRTKYSSSCDGSPYESNGDCYDCVPKKPGKKCRG